MKYFTAYYNWTEFNGQFLLTNDIGKFCFLSKNEFYNFLEDKLSPQEDTFNLLKKQGFLYHDNDEYISVFQYDMTKMKKCLHSATNLIIFVLTDSCNQRCIYCQAGKVHTSKMSVEICKKAVNLAVQSPISHITIEFQGGEPTLNPEALKFTIPYAKDIFNEKGKHVDFALVSNMTNPDTNLLRWLIEQDVHISTSLDGNRIVHEYNRPLAIKESSYDTWHKGIGIYKELCKECGKEPIISAIQTTTRKSLSYPEEIVEEYISNGINKLYIRPLTPLGYAHENWNMIGYTTEEYLKFYHHILDYMIEKCKHGTYVSETTASIYLKRILNGESVNHTEFRSPCGAAVGQIAINYDGEIYTCDEGRMLANMGNNIFRLGNVNNTYKELMQSPVTHAVCSMSCVEALPLCCDCAYSPYCSVCPVVSYGIEKDLLQRNENSYRCAIAKGIITYLFKIINKNTPAEMTILQQWANDQK